MRTHHALGLLLIAAAGCGDGARRQIILEGDSLTAPETGYVDEFSVADAWRVVSHGTGGQMAEEMAAERARVIDPLFDATLETNVLVVFAGTNDFYHGRTVEQTLASVESICSGAQKAGFQVVVCTLLPSNLFDKDYKIAGVTNDEQSATHEALRQEFNSALRDGYERFADYLLDLGADPLIGDKGDELSTHWYADQLHPSKHGKKLISSKVRDTLFFMSL